jgi:GDPmannose 4,6-dehydratase
MAAPSARPVLVTGAAGQDGSYVVESLVGSGTEVHGILRPGEVAPAGFAALASLTLHEVDLTEADTVRGLVERISPSAVINLAGISSVAQSWDEPVLTTAVNSLAVAVLLDAAIRVQEQTREPVRFVQASSAEIFAGSPVTPQDESTPIHPVSPYGASKAAAHLLVQVYRDRGLAASNAILYNHESPRRPTTFVTRKITTGVAAIARGDAHELVLGNLRARRDWGWAPDYVDALIRMSQAEVADDYVVATGVAHSVEDFAAAAFAAVGIDDWSRYVRVDPDLLRPADATELLGDAGRAHRQLGWSPTTGFDDMVRQMVEIDLA